MTLNKPTRWCTSPRCSRYYQTIDYNPPTVVHYIQKIILIKSFTGSYYRYLPKRYFVAVFHAVLPFQWSDGSKCPTRTALPLILDVRHARITSKIDLMKK
jgi:hypothetical protein